MKNAGRYKKELGILLKVARKRAKLTQQAVADELRIKQSVVHEWEAGDRGVDVGELVVISTLFDTDAGELAQKIQKMHKKAIRPDTAMRKPITKQSLKRNIRIFT